MRYELSRRARSDIKEIIRYTLEYFGRKQADDYVDGLYYSFKLVEDNPRLGQSIGQGENLRRYIYRSHYVFYEIRGKVIRIATIRNTRQELPPEWR